MYFFASQCFLCQIFQPKPLRNVGLQYQQSCCGPGKCSASAFRTQCTNKRINHESKGVRMAGDIRFVFLVGQKNTCDSLWWISATDMSKCSRLWSRQWTIWQRSMTKDIFKHPVHPTLSAPMRSSFNADTRQQLFSAKPRAGVNDEAELLPSTGTTLYHPVSILAFICDFRSFRCTSSSRWM